MGSHDQLPTAHQSQLIQPKQKSHHSTNQRLALRSSDELTCEGVETLHDDEHVVYPDAEEEEGHHGVGGGVEEAEDGAEAVADHNPHHDAQDAAHAQVHLLLHAVPPAVTPLSLLPLYITARAGNEGPQRFFKEANYL